MYIDIPGVGVFTAVLFLKLFVTISPPTLNISKFPPVRFMVWLISNIKCPTVQSSQFTLSQTGYDPENMLNIKVLSIMLAVNFSLSIVCIESILIFHSTNTKKKTERPYKKEMQGNAIKIRIFQNKEFWQEEEMQGKAVMHVTQMKNWS